MSMSNRNTRRHAHAAHLHDVGGAARSKHHPVAAVHDVRLNRKQHTNRTTVRNAENENDNANRKRAVTSDCATRATMKGHATVSMRCGVELLGREHQRQPDGQVLHAVQVHAVQTILKTNQIACVKRSN